MNKEARYLKQFKESCNFYCDYHKVGTIETNMICGNLEQVVLRIIKAINKNKDSIQVANLLKVWYYNNNPLIGGGCPFQALHRDHLVKEVVLCQDINVARGFVTESSKQQVHSQ